MKKAFLKTGWLLGSAVLAMLLTASAYAAVPGIVATGGSAGTFVISAEAAYIVQPDGASIYSWGYGCASGTATFAQTVGNVTFPNVQCTTMQIPGPTMVVHAPASGTSTFTVTLHNNLPAAAGNTSILFPGFQVSTSGGVAGLLTQEAEHGGTVIYTVTVPATAGGTHSYYSGTQGDLQVEMGLYGAIIVIPSAIPSACTSGLAAKNVTAERNWGERDYRLAAAAWNHPKACYDREYMFQFSEMDPAIHHNAEVQVAAKAGCTAGTPGCSLNVPTEPYHPAYYLVNGRSMPDLMDPEYAPEYPHQPYNANPHMHPGEQVLVRVVGTGRWQHPFHEHANHVRILGRDGNIIVSQTNPTTDLAGPVLFTTSTVPGQTADGIFYYTGKGLNWDMYGHHPGSNDPNAKLTCSPDPDGYNTGDATAINYFEWCQDHNKPLEVAPFGDVATGGPVTLPDPNLLTYGNWFGGSPYLGPDATSRSTFGTCTGSNTTTNCGTTGVIPPSGTVANSPSTEAGFAFMWHSHNEREITTNNIFPGGMLVMMLVDSREFVIDESM
jgi:FtsP/CotA-like multicopper oxidase with cupredoxin domain